MQNEMIISVISLFTPTEQNYGGASALPYALLQNLPKASEVTVYSFNINGVGEDNIRDIAHRLNIRITLVPIHHRMMLLDCNKLSSYLRIFLSKPVAAYLTLSSDIVKEIRANSDRLWIYGEDLSELKNLFPGLKCVVTTPDCEALYYKRVLDMPSKCGSLISKIRYRLAYRQFANLANCHPTEDVKYHLVGVEDRDYLKKLNPDADATFLPHPHYKGNEERKIGFKSPKIRLLLPGRYDFYCKEAVDEAVEAMAASKDLIHFYEVTFQGKNWHEKAEVLRNAGFEVNEVGFVDCYEDELCRHDIQLSPISLGTGTKGKVLDAFVNGLLVIAPLRAIENIQVEDNKDYLYYERGEELIEILRNIPKDISKYERIAEEGRKTILEKHSPKNIGRQFAELLK